MRLCISLLLLGIMVDASDAPNMLGASTIVRASRELAEWSAPTRGRNSLRRFSAEDAYAFDEFYENAYENAWSLCIDSLWNTCVGRCGSYLSGPPYICGCDPMCAAYGDCCMDYELECTFNGPYLNRSQFEFFDNLGSFTCIDLSRDMNYGVLIVTSCSPSWDGDDNETWIGNWTKTWCESLSPNSYEPYQGRYGIVYKNLECAICNGDMEATKWTEPSICRPQPLDEPFQTFRDLCKIESDLYKVGCAPYRVCSYDVNECPPFSPGRAPALSQHAWKELEDMCADYSKPVFGHHPLRRSMQMFKNVHCAHCNKVATSNLYCPAWKLITTTRNNGIGSPVFFFETGHDADNKRNIKEIPASFAILFYFGEDGNKQNMFSSQSATWWGETLTDCDTNQIWDPFNEACRDIYCSAEFTLVDFHCIDTYNSTHDDVDGGQNLNTTMVPSMDLTSVLIVLEIQLDCCLDADVDAVLQEKFTDALAVTVNISAYRFTNFTMYNATNGTSDEACQQESVVSTVLLSPDPMSNPPEASIENVVALLSYSVSLNQLLLHLQSGYTIRVFGIQEKVVQYSNQTANRTTDDWCVDGNVWYYTNGEFAPIVVNDDPHNYTLYLYVNVTGRVYLPGQFIANILFQGTQRSVVANVSGAALVCDRSSDNNTCVRVLLQRSDYVPLPNGSILYVGNETDERVIEPGSYEVLPNGGVLVCVTLPPPPNATMQTPLNVGDLRAQSLLTTVMLSCSSAATLVTIVTYIAFAELRNGPGWNMIHFASSLLLYQVVYLVGMRPSLTTEPLVCKAVAVVLHFTLLAFFFWSNAIAYDLYEAFGLNQLVPAASRRTKRLPFYAAYAYGVPLLVVSTCVTLDQLSPAVLDVDYGEGEVCWIGDPLSLAVFFVAPTALILVGNLVLYVLTVRAIRAVRRKAALTTGQRSSKSDLVVYARICTVMGFTWVFGYLSGVPGFSYPVRNVFAYLFIIFSAFQGVFICVAFMFNRKVYNLYANCYLVGRLCALLRLTKCVECDKYVCGCPKPVKRTISNETCQTVVPDDQSDRSTADSLNPSAVQIQVPM